MDNQITNQPTQEEIEKDVKEVVDEVRQEIYDKSRDISHHELLSCLYFIFDAFSRVGMDFFLVKQTAKWMMNEDELRGDHLDIGVRSLEWANDNKDMLFEYFNYEHVKILSQLPNKITFEWHEIPFTVHLYEDNPCITSLKPIVYEHEGWFVPDQFERFEKEYDHD